MSKQYKPSSVKLFMSVIYNDCGKNILNRLKTELEDYFGHIDFCTNPIKFDYTDYYEPEMGATLQREFITFSSLVARDSIAQTKLITNRLETKYSDNGKRNINIDPGLVTYENIVLSTNKNYTHRIYLTNGVYAEVTLIFTNKSYRPLQWTFPDYASESIINLFNSIRIRYISELKRLK